MTKPCHLAIVLASLYSCSTSSSHQHVVFAHLAFDVPGDWTSRTSSQRDLSSAVWTPDNNERGESVTVVRSERAPAIARAGSPTLERLVAQAQAGLPGAQVSAIVPLATQNGLSGVRVELDYIPPGMHERYHRVHAVLVDHDSLIHVLYTAKTADESLAAFNLLLATIHEGERL